MKSLTSLVLTILFLNFLNGCRSQEIQFEGEQCAPFFVYVDETQKLIDVDKSFCSVRVYEMNIDRVGSLPGTDAKRPLPYCNKCVGFKKYDKFATFAETVRVEIVEGQSEGFARKVKEPTGTIQD